MHTKTLDERYSLLLYRFTAAARECFGAKLTGVYLHGSMAMGCFRPEISDIDLLVVTETELDSSEKLAFMEQVVALNGEAPAKGIEMSVLPRSACKPFLYPTPFLLHFSPMHLDWFRHDPQGYVQHMNGTDPDLAAHVTILHHYGIVLYGAPIEQVFGEVSREDYLSSILYDVEEACETMAAHPVSTILNLCRVLAFVCDDVCLSKPEAARWALGSASFPIPDVELVVTAARKYHDGWGMDDPGQRGREFACEMLRLIHERAQR